MGKAQPVHPGNLDFRSLRRAFRTMTSWRETKKAQRAHRVAVVAKFQVMKSEPTASFR